MNDLDQLKVEAFTAKRVLNPYPGGKMPWQVFHTVRNAVVGTCRKFGTTGPMAEVTIDHDVDDPQRQAELDPDFWQHGDANPQYHIVEDPSGPERFIHAELHGKDAFNAKWLTAITTTLRDHRGWGVEIGNIPDSFVVIFSKRLLVRGRKLAKCKTAADVVQVAVRLLERGNKPWWQFWK